jgi:hypothetical protein
MKIRIQFLKADKVIKTFDREIHDPSAAAELAAQIAKDSGIEHDSEKIIKERKFKALILNGAKRVELIEAKAFDEADAKAIGEAWAKRNDKSCTEVKVQFLEA